MLSGRCNIPKKVDTLQNVIRSGAGLLPAGTRVRDIEFVQIAGSTLEFGVDLQSAPNSACIFFATHRYMHV